VIVVDKDKPSDKPAINTLSNLPQDKPTAAVKPWVRLVVSIFSWIILSKAASSPGTNFFASLSIFSFSLFSEYLRFTVIPGWRTKMKSTGIFLSLFWLMLGLSGMADVLSIVYYDGPNINNLPYLKFSDSSSMLQGIFSTSGVFLGYFWLAIGISIICTAADWVIATSPKEVREIAIIREVLKGGESVTS